MGIDRAEQVFNTTYFPWPRLTLAAGERARFHFLTSGYDEYFDGGRMHVVDVGGYTRDALCLRTYTNGAERCPLCAQGHDDTINRFACWVYCHHIVHLGDNPDPDGPTWRQARLGDRIVFVEDVNRPLLIWMKAGRRQAWFGQFKAMANRYGTLEGRLYELRRIGAGRDDTDYVLSAVKEEALAPDVLASCGQLTPVGEILRSTAGQVAARVGLSEVASEDLELELPAAAEDEVPHTLGEELV